MEVTIINLGGSIRIIDNRDTSSTIEVLKDGVRLQKFGDICRILFKTGTWIDIPYDVAEVIGFDGSVIPASSNAFLIALQAVLTDYNGGTPTSPYNFSFKVIEEGVTVTIPEPQQMTVFGSMRVDGVLNVDGELILTDLPLDGLDGIDGTDGTDGIDGDDGVDGDDGRGIVSESYNAATGELTLTFSDSTTYVTSDMRSQSEWKTIQTQTASASASIDFILTGGYTQYRIEIIGLISATNIVELWARMGTGGTPTYGTGGSDYVHTRSTGVLTSFAAAGGTDSKIVLQGATVGKASTNYLDAEIIINDPSNTARHKSIRHHSHSFSSGGTYYSQGTGRYVNTAAVTAIRLLLSSGNIASGTFILSGK